MEGQKAQAAPAALAPPPGNPRFPGLDGMRALATASVLIFHVGLHSDTLGSSGWRQWLGEMTFGPSMFFMFSGFLLYRPFVSARYLGTPRPTTTSFFRTRALRVIPAYWVALTLLAIYPGLRGDVFGSDFWAYYGMAHIYSGDTVAGGLVISWTLCTELTFYLALPIVAFLGAWAATRFGVRRSRVLELVALAVVALLSFYWLYHFDRLPGYSAMDFAHSLWLPGMAMFFATGMALAILTVQLPGERSLRDRIPSWWAFSVGCFALALFIYWVRLPLDLKAPELAVLNGLLSMIALLPCVFARPTDRGPERFLAGPTMLWLGLIAYGVYLYHSPIARKLSEEGVGSSSLGGYLLILAIVTALSVALATLSYYFVERPALRYKYRRGRSRAIEPAPAGAVSE